MLFLIKIDMLITCRAATSCEPSGAGRSWKGGPRERADDAFFPQQKKMSEQSGLCSDVVLLIITYPNDDDLPKGKYYILWGQGSR